MRLIYFLLLYYPFHELFLKLSGSSGASLFLLRQWPDICIFLMYSLAAANQGLRGGLSLEKGGVASWVIGFLLWAIVISVATQGNNLGVALSEIYVLFRFVALYGLIALLQPSASEVRSIVGLLIFSAATQALLGCIQLIGGPQVMEFFKPVDYSSSITGIERSFTSNREAASRTLIGTTGDFVSFSYMMALGVMTTYFSKINKNLKFVLCLLFLLLLFMAGSRTVVLGTIIAMALFAWFESRIDKQVLVLLLLMLCLTPIAWLMEDYTQLRVYSYEGYLALFDKRTLESLLNQRLGVQLYVIPEFIRSGDFLLGLSPDRFFISDRVGIDYTGVPIVLQRVLPEVLEDVYPSALFIYYGLPGLTLTIVIVTKLYRMAKVVHRNLDHALGGISMVVVMAMVLYSFGNQAIENRIFSFHFWLIIGLAASNLKSREKVNADTPRT